MSEINEFLADVKQEGSDPFEQIEKDLEANTEKETPSESLPVKEPEADKPGEGQDTPEDNLPFHKHPRWIERENELRTLREQREADAQAIAELATFKEETTKRFTQSEESTIPEWFSELYGDNPIAWQKYSEHEKQKEAEIEQRFFARQEETRKQEVEKQQQENQKVVLANEWIDNEITRLESEGKKFDRNELLLIMTETRPTTADGSSFDFNAGYRTYELRHQNDVNPAKSQARKQLADTTSKSSVGERKVPDYHTPASLRNKSWNQLLD